MGRKHDKHEKARAKDKKGSTEPRTTRENTPRLCGCPVPEPVECFLGREANDDDDGVIMECSNVHCPYVETKIHISCFKAFEDHLVKLMSNIGSARGWTDAQRRCNLWEKKGQSLVAKVCRCRCGLGTTRRDDEIYYNQTKSSKDENVPGTPVSSSKKKNPKALPKLNFGVMKTTGNIDEPSKPKRSSRRREISSSTVSSVSHIYNYDFEYRRESMTYATDSTAISVVSFNPGDMDDNLSVCSRSEVFYDSQEISPSPVPPKPTKTYASATKTSISISDEHTEISLDSGVEMKSSSTTSSEIFDDMPKELLSPDVCYDTPKPEKTWTSKIKHLPENISAFLEFETGVSTTSTPLVAKPTSKLSQDVLTQSVICCEELTHYYSIHEEEVDLSQIPEWNLFTGTNFGIGETIIGLTALPGFYLPLNDEISVL